MYLKSQCNIHVQMGIHLPSMSTWQYCLNSQSIGCGRILKSQGTIKPFDQKSFAPILQTLDSHLWNCTIPIETLHNFRPHAIAPQPIGALAVPSWPAGAACQNAPDPPENRPRPSPPPPPTLPPPPSTLPPPPPSPSPPPPISLLSSTLRPLHLGQLPFFSN